MSIGTYLDTEIPLIVEKVLRSQARFTLSLIYFSSLYYIGFFYKIYYDTLKYVIAELCVYST
jgi:hypothetical protein